MVVVEDKPTPVALGIGSVEGASVIDTALTKDTGERPPVRNDAGGQPDEAGKPSSSATGGGRQTAEQAAITGMGPTGRSDAERSRARSDAGSKSGRDPAAIGGSSSGQSDQNSASGGGKVAGWHDDVEKDRT